MANDECIYRVRRSLIRGRKCEDIAAARKAEKQFGRRKTVSDDQVVDISHRVVEGVAESLCATEYRYIPHNSRVCESDLNVIRILTGYRKDNLIILDSWAYSLLLKVTTIITSERHLTR